MDEGEEEEGKLGKQSRKRALSCLLCAYSLHILISLFVLLYF